MNFGIVGRFKPLHLGTEQLLNILCSTGEKVFIGIGSANKYDARNPFTPAETREMIELALMKYDNYVLLDIPDFGDGEKWAGFVWRAFGNLDYFVSGNEYVIDLLKDKYYRILHPLAFTEATARHIRSTMVRMEIAKDNENIPYPEKKWWKYVSSAVSSYIRTNKLDVRIRKEFGQEILNIANIDLPLADLIENEKKWTIE